MDNVSLIDTTGLTNRSGQTNKTKARKAADLGKDEFLNLLNSLVNTTLRSN